MKEITNDQRKFEILRKYREGAEQGDAEAQYHYGTSYYWGYFVKQDYNEAVKWLQKAAEQGHIGAIRS